MALVPFADHKLIRPGPSDPRIQARVGILHVDAGNAYDLHDYFDGRSGGIESHFHVPKDGTLFQYRDTDWQADANYHANDFALSVETQGFGEGVWTDAQLDTIKRLMLWCRDVHGIPLKVADKWDGEGWGYHIMHGSPGHWTPVAKACPGPDRIRQFHDVLVPWMAGQNRPPKPELTDVEEVLAGLRNDVERLLAMAETLQAMKKRMRVRGNKIADDTALTPVMRGLGDQADATEEAVRDLRQAVVKARAELAKEK